MPRPSRSLARRSFAAVGQGNPKQDRAGLFLAADGELLKPHAAPSGIEAFVLGSLSIDVLATIARHPLAPISYGHAVARLRRIRIGAVPGLSRRAPQLCTSRLRPLDIVVFGEPGRRPDSQRACSRGRARPRSPGAPSRDPSRWCRCQPRQSAGFSAQPQFACCKRDGSRYRPSSSPVPRHPSSKLAAPSAWPLPAGCRVGLAPTGKRRLVTAHAINGRRLLQSLVKGPAFRLSWFTSAAIVVAAGTNSCSRPIVSL